MMRGDRDGRGSARLRACLNAAFGIALCLLALPALALGLGQIEVKSRPGQPLLAEIPIITSDPTELQGLTARLAPPETFRRIGLEPPQGIVSGLSFEPALNAAGRPVIRVTSAAPVEQPALTFLLEVDWGQGRLVREYVAQVQVPDSLPAQVAAPVQAPAPAPDGLIERPAASVPPETTAPDGEAAAAIEPVDEAAPPAATAPAIASQPEPPEPEPERAANPDYTVQRGDTLSQIARELSGVDGYSLDQAMLALLQANPEAFIGENVNRLRAGAVLRMPAQEALSRYSTAQAAGIVREQVATWRASQRAQATATATSATAATEAGSEVAAPGPQVADARLEIAPPRASGGERAGTQSGASAGGEGDMLRQELQETKETLAARDAELAELKTRVAELEQLQQQQQNLIEMKDDALAGAQQRLAQVEAARPDADAAIPPPGASGWWWALPLVLLLGGLAWWLARRRRHPIVAAASRTRVSDAFATPAVVTEEDVGAESEDAEPQWVGNQQAEVTPAPAPATPPVDGEPTWVSGTPPGAESIASLNQAPAGRDRIELARAYVELGDRATARTLLQEVVDGGDSKAREEARRALQLLG
jgi:pilus assembly protein FimV